MQRDAIYEKIKYIFYNNNRTVGYRAMKAFLSRDFTYMRSPNGKFRYNCTIIDLFDRSVVASMNGKCINSDLAKDTLKMALEILIIII